MTPIIIFNHGKESGPNGRKISVMREVAEAAGYKTLSPDYRGCKDETERIALLRSVLNAENNPDVVLAGSSMGGYVAATVANEIELKGLFLLCPALYQSHFQAQVYQPRTSNIELVHGWDDNIVPVQSSMRFAQEHKAILHLVTDGHRLTESVNLIAGWLGDFLARITNL